MLDFLCVGGWGAAGWGVPGWAEGSTRGRGGGWGGKGVPVQVASREGSEADKARSTMSTMKYGEEGSFQVKTLTG